jgi:hypothetical protein
LKRLLILKKSHRWHYHIHFCMRVFVQRCFSKLNLKKYYRSSLFGRIQSRVKWVASTSVICLFYENIRVVTVSQNQKTTKTLSKPIPKLNQNKYQNCQNQYCKTKTSKPRVLVLVHAYTYSINEESKSRGRGAEGVD